MFWGTFKNADKNAKHQGKNRYLFFQHYLWYPFQLPISKYIHPCKLYYCKLLLREFPPPLTIAYGQSAPDSRSVQTREHKFVVNFVYEM